MARIRLDDPCYYFNRHESWMAFNRRVLEEAQDEGNPLLERVKFLAITASNLDEFVEVRIAALLQQLEHGNQVAGPDGLSPAEQLQRLAREIHSFVNNQYQCWNELGSADWMPRNLYERVEVMFPIKSAALRERKTRILHQNGSYSRAYQASNSKNDTNGSRFSAQDFFMDLAEGRGTAKPTSRKYRTIAPVLVA